MTSSQLVGGGNGMAMRVSVVVLAATLAVICVLMVLVLVPQRAQAASGTIKTCGGTTQLNADEGYMLARHNQVRKKHGLKALCVNPTLTQAARAHSQEMLDKDYASHNSFNGETVKQRLARFGYTTSGYSYYALGENIAWGCGSSGSPDHIFHWWMHSRDHRHNILNKKFREVGIGVRTGTFKSCGQATMYTVDFGTRQR
jgi:uncharacterized protein YkwD